MDQFDQAQEITEQFLEASIAAARITTSYPDGHCLWCDAELDNGHFCNADCRDDFERSARVKRRGAPL